MPKGGVAVLQSAWPRPSVRLSASGPFYQDVARSTPAVADGDPIASWTELMSGAHPTQATTTKRPLLRTNVLNGYPAVQFDGVDDYLEGAMSARTASTWVIVAKKTNAMTVAQDVLLGVRLNGTNRNQFYSASFVPGYNYFANQGGTGTAIGGTPTNWNIVTLSVASASSMSIRLNGGAAIATFDPSDICTTAVIYDLCIDNGTASTAGDYMIAAAQRFDSNLSLGDHGDLHRMGSYFDRKFALGLWTPPS